MPRLSFNGTSSIIKFGNGTEQNIASRIINFQRFTYNVRTSWGDTSSAVIWSPTVTKLSSSSNLYVEVHLSMRNNYSDCLVHEVQFANSSWFQGTMPYDAGFSANSRPYRSTFYITGVTTTGNQTLNLRWRTANSTGGNKPAQIWNPNSSDDGRYFQEYSSMEVYEII